MDVRELDGFMLNVERAMASELVALSTGDEFKAAFLLWCRAWKQIPAGSLPNDEGVLAAFSGAGGKWRKVRTMALRGFVECSDGRLYHRTLCEDVYRAWSQKQKFDEERGNESERKRRERDERSAIFAQLKTVGVTPKWNTPIRALRELATCHGPVTRTGGGPVTDLSRGQVADKTPPVTANTGQDRTGQDRTGQDRTEKPVVPKANAFGANGADSPSSAKPEWWPSRDRYGRVTSEITDKIAFDVGKAVLGKSSGGQITRLRKCKTDLRTVVDLLLQAEEKSSPSEWFAKVVSAAEVDERTLPKHEIYPEAEYRA